MSSRSSSSMFPCLPVARSVIPLPLVAAAALALVLSALPKIAAADTFVATFGGSALDWGSDLAVAPDGDLLIAGAIHADTPLPDGVTTHRLVADEDGDHRGFVARLTPDGETIRWLALFPADTFVPSRIAVDGERIALGGDPLARMATHLPPLHSSYDRAALVVLSTDGTTVLGARGGPPNVPRGLRTRDGEHRGYQAGITGIALHGGLIYVTGSTSGTGQAGYIVRYDAESLDGVDFPNRPDPGRTWAIDLHRTAPDLQETLIWRYDPEHPDAEYHQGDCRIRLSGNRRGGQVLVTDWDGGTIFGTFDIQYDFNCVGRWFPAFDAGIAAWTLDGELKWATNALDRMVSEPDQGPQALAWDPVRARLVVALWQHGSNVARLPGQLTGDTGNISIGWVGVLDPTNGDVQHAWYQHAVRQDSNGEWNEDGTVARWPSNSGNTVHRLAVDADGRVLVLSTGGNRMFTTADALQDWPRDLWGGHTTLTALSPDLARIEYATALRPTAVEGAAGSTPAGLAVNRHGLFVFGRTGADNFLRLDTDRAPWSTPRGDRNDLFLARIAPENLPFEPTSPREEDFPEASAPGSEASSNAGTDAPSPSAPPGSDHSSAPESPPQDGSSASGSDPHETPDEDATASESGDGAAEEAGATSGGESGCGCASAGGTGGGAAGWLLLGFATLALRRRRA